MRRIVVSIVSLALFAAACSDDDALVAPSTSPPTTTAVVTTTAPPTTTTSTSTTTTTTTTSTTTTQPPKTTTTTIAPVVEPVGPPRTPLGELTSFTAESSVSVALGDATFGVDSSGTRVGAVFECRVEVSIGGLKLTQRSAGDGNTFWLDDGSGFSVVAPGSSDLQDVDDLCPVGVGFWDEFGIDIPPELVGERAFLGDLPVQEYDFTGALDFVQDMGLIPELEGVTVETITASFAEPGGWLAGFALDARIDADQTAEVFGLPFAVDDGDVARVMLSIAVARPDDPTLAVTLP
ncbi:MAG: hypothetical protein ACE5GC_08425 [Acidimicrobiia bacterium]